MHIIVADALFVVGLALLPVPRFTGLFRGTLPCDPDKAIGGGTLELLLPPCDMT